MASSKEQPHSDENTSEAPADKKNAEEIVTPLHAEVATEEPLSEAEAQEKKFAEMEENFLYLRAEFENYKRNAIKDRSQLMKYGAQRLAQDLLDTVDVFSQALNGEVTKENFEPFLEGIKMTHSQLQQTLEKHGIKEVEVIGQNFDPATQEALGTEPTSDFEPGQVCRVFKSPYTYHDKLLRAGQVFVAKEKEADG